MVALHLYEDQPQESTYKITIKRGNYVGIVPVPDTSTRGCMIACETTLGGSYTPASSS